MASPKSLFTLPGEIRNKIYSLVVSPNLPDFSTSDTSSATSSLGAVATSIGFDTSIIYTNRQISKEATHVFYRDHLFARVRFTFSSAADSITNLGLHGTIRRNAENCPWITMVINVDDADDINESEGPSVDIVVAHHDMPLLANLMLYMHQQIDRHPLKRRHKLELKIQVVNKVRVSAIIINEKLLLPLTHVRGYDNEDVEFCDPEVAKDFEWHLPPRANLSGVQYVVAQLSLARALERNQEWQGTSIATKIALSYADKKIDRVCFHDELDPTTLITLLKLRVEASVYDVSRSIRTGGSGTTLDLFLGYCQALDAARPGTRLLALCLALEQYLRFAQGIHSTNQYPTLPRMLKNAVHHDPRNDLKLDAQAILRMVDDTDANYTALNNQLTRSLRFSELSATLSRLYSVAGIQ